MSNPKAYVGDGAYVEVLRDGTNDVVLTTENGLSVTNRIVLEPTVLQALLDALKRFGVLK